MNGILMPHGKLFFFFLFKHDSVVLWKPFFFLSFFLNISTYEGDGRGWVHKLLHYVLLHVNCFTKLFLFLNQN